MILDEEERPIVRFRVGGVVRYHAHVEVIEPNDDHLALLIPFGWYLIVMLTAEWSAVTTAATS